MVVITLAIVCVSKRQNGTFTMKKRRVFAGILLIACLLFACQAIPSQEVVVNKNDGKLEEIISSEAIESEQAIIENEPDDTISENKLEIGVLSERWSQSYSIQGLDCAIDADIILPDKKEFPVYKIKQREFDDSAIQKVLEYYIKDATGMHEISPTKEELEMQLIQAKRGWYTEVDGVVTWEPYDGQQEEIARLEEQIKNTGEEIFLPVTNDIVLPKADTYEMQDGSRVHVWATSNSIAIQPLKCGIVQPESWVKAGDAYPGEPAGTTLDNVKISQQEANEIVKSFLDEAGIENMGIAESEKARMLLDMTYETISEGWYISLSRNDGGSVRIYIDNQPSGILYQRSEDYVQRWYPEVIRIYVDETGVKTFVWKYPVEVMVEVLNQNVLVLDFEEFKERVLEYIKFGFSFVKEMVEEDGGELTNQKIEVNKIVLTNVMIPIKDDTNHQMLAPAWIIYYTQECGMNTVSSFIAVNAIDGSSIDLKVR